MPPKRKKQQDSDADYYFAPSVANKRACTGDPTFFQTSSAPTSPQVLAKENLSDDSEDDTLDGNIMRPLPDLLSHIVDGMQPGRPAVFLAKGVDTPQKKRAVSESPRDLPSPATSTIFDPSPLKPKGGRPRNTGKCTRNPRNLSSEARTGQKSIVKEASKASRADRRKKATAEAAERKQKENEARAAEAKEAQRARALDYLDKLTRPVEEGGAGFDSVREFLDVLVDPANEAQASANLTRFLRSNGEMVMKELIKRVPSIGEEFIDQKFDEKLNKVLRKEGKAIQHLLSRDWTTSVTELLKEFSMEELGRQLEDVAPTVWRILDGIGQAGAETRRASQGEARRQKSLVFTTVCAMLSISRSQQANNYQVVIGIFLLASGASKREMEVLAKAGLSTSYTMIKEHVATLSKEGTEHFRQLIKQQMCFIVWDNLNIAFRVESQRLNSANHFDNGTTATLIPVYNPFTGDSSTPHGTLPLEMKPPRTSTFPVVDWNYHEVLPSPSNAEELTRCCIWQLKRLAFENIASLADLRLAFEECPEVDPIAVHTTPTFPLPAMHEDESSIDGTIRVYVQILRHLGMSNEDLRAHGLMFHDGDLLTDSLIDKIESARRNSDGEIEGLKASVRRFGLFHAKMAGCRLVLNEHWGKPNSIWPGSLWWEHNKLLKRKPISAGWKAKKAAPWKQSHELLQISAAAHVKDGFRIHCGHADLDVWAASASMADFDAVANRVYRELFSTEALDKLRALSPDLRDITLENAILLNRDTLFYLEFVSAIKKGDIGRVTNVLRVWMVMMRTPKTMPKYADAIFETLARIDRYDPVFKRFFLHNWLVNLTGRPNGFKEIDLLQEHQNFWAKIIYNAKGVNRSWEWLSMITVCIFTLRETMRSVQKSFKITEYGLHHTVPDMSKEIDLLADALRDERIQEYFPSRAGNDQTDATSTEPTRDLFGEGSKYPDTRGAFKKFTKDERRAQNMGFTASEEDDDADEDVEEESGMEEQYEVTAEDLEMDDEEPYGVVQ